MIFEYASTPDGRAGPRARLCPGKSPSERRRKRRQGRRGAPSLSLFIDDRCEGALLVAAHDTLKGIGSMSTRVNCAEVKSETAAARSTARSSTPRQYGMTKASEALWSTPTPRARAVRRYESPS